MSERIAVFGGVYSNHAALDAALADARERGVDRFLCLGDLGAFGPNPDKVVERLRDEAIPVVRGNYDDSLARGLDDCQCGYTDPADNHFARLSYGYTFRRTAEVHRKWMAGLPSEIRFDWDGVRVLACHGSPRQTNEFLWESTTPRHFLAKLGEDHEADLILGTHTGLPWRRSWGGVPNGGGQGGVEDGGGVGDRARVGAESVGGVGARVVAGVGAGAGEYVNVGALGRPANDGCTDVWYTLVGVEAGRPTIEFVPVAYDHEGLAEEMRSEDLPDEFIETILTGWWTTCLEILPAKERARGRF